MRPTSEQNEYKNALTNLQLLVWPVPHWALLVLLLHPHFLDSVEAGLPAVAFRMLPNSSNRKIASAAGSLIDSLSLILEA